MCHGGKSNAESMKISSWNINGHKSRNIGNKFLDRDFLDEIKEDGLVGIVETHIYDEILDKLLIPVFKLLTYKNRTFNKISKKGDGGIAVFIKEKFSKFIIPEKIENPDSIWVKINKELSGEDDDIFVGTVYLTPPKSKNDDSNKMDALEDEIFKFRQLGRVIIQGDFNARTGTERDYIVPDKYDTNTNIAGTRMYLDRNSEDKVSVDNRGRELLDICKSMGVVILNGRKTGDFYGKLTCFQWNGSSAVDYVLASETIYESVDLFKVGVFFRGYRIIVQHIFE